MTLRRRRGAAHRAAEPGGAGGRAAASAATDRRPSPASPSARYVIRAFRHEPARSACTVDRAGDDVSTVSGGKPWHRGTSSRARVPITILVTLLIVLGEFGFLQVVYHLDDHVERAARARRRGSPARSTTWQPGADTAAVEEAVRALATTDAPGADAASRP